VNTNSKDDMRGKKDKMKISLHAMHHTTFSFVFSVLQCSFYVQALNYLTRIALK